VTALPLVRFGDTDLAVTRLCQGTAFRTLARDETDRRAESVLRHCLDRGVRFFDSSNAYGWGGSERLLGAALRGRRDEVVICTKVSPHPPPEAATTGPRRFTGAFLQQELEGSLRRLQTERIDLFLLHSPDGVTPADELCTAMQGLLEGGAVRHWGLSNHGATQVEAILRAARELGTTPPVGVEEYYNIAGTALSEGGRSRVRQMGRDLLPLARRESLGVLAFGPLDGGALAPGRSPEEGSALAPLLQTIDDAARQLGVSRAVVCVAWVLARPGVSVVLGGAESPAHVDETIEGATLVLPTEIDARLSAAHEACADALEGGRAGRRRAGLTGEARSASFDSDRAHPCERDLHR
jgi:aryl-alcohol dehydrogenase-like predicted oxidoreductase